MAGNDARSAQPVIVAAHDEWLRDAGGREYIDVSMGYGSVWLGHNHPAVTLALVSQLERYSAPGYLPTGTLEAAEVALRHYIPDTHYLGGIYSTGMEAMETALRAACIHSGRADFVGFSGSTHGRSFVTAAIGGEVSTGGLEFVHRLPSFARARPNELVVELRQLAQRAALAAIVVEPIQMTGGGHEIPAAACAALFEIAREHAIPVLFDETLTGLYRCGRQFFFEGAGGIPDLLVIGKGMGNGFPCAAVVLRKEFTWDRHRVRPGSTFWNHPLACVAVATTLQQLRRLQPVDKVREIEAVIRAVLGKLELRGRGAMWCLRVPDSARQADFAQRILDAGVIVSYYEGYIRLLPSLTIGLDSLAQACDAIRKSYVDTFG